MPLTEDGAARLAVELERAQERIDPPALVWLFDPETLSTLRAALYGWRPGDPRRGLIVRQEWSPLHDVVAWVCEPFLHPRRE